jgi:hypothetical protein
MKLSTLLDICKNENLDDIDIGVSFLDIKDSKVQDLVFTTKSANLHNNMIFLNIASSEVIDILELDGWNKPVNLQLKPIES